jgi:hypothetical protein
MRVERAPNETPPRPAWLVPLRWIAGLPTRVSNALAKRRAFFRFDAEEETDPELADLWLLLSATDPDGIWHAWPGALRKSLDHDNTRS